MPTAIQVSSLYAQLDQALRAPGGWRSEALDPQMVPPNLTERELENWPAQYRFVHDQGLDVTLWTCAPRADGGLSYSVPWRLCYTQHAIEVCHTRPVRLDQPPVLHQKMLPANVGTLYIPAAPWGHALFAPSAALFGEVLDAVAGTRCQDLLRGLSDLLTMHNPDIVAWGQYVEDEDAEAFFPNTRFVDCNARYDFESEAMNTPLPNIDPEEGRLLPLMKHLCEIHVSTGHYPVLRSIHALRLAPPPTSAHERMLAQQTMRKALDHPFLSSAIETFAISPSRWPRKSVHYLPVRWLSQAMQDMCHIPSEATP